MSELGRGVKQDYAKAIELYQEATKLRQFLGRIQTGPDVREWYRCPGRFRRSHEMASEGSEEGAECRPGRRPKVGISFLVNVGKDMTSPE
jgi:hypothetical protein